MRSEPITDAKELALWAAWDFADPQGTFESYAEKTASVPLVHEIVPSGVTIDARDITPVQTVGTQVQVPTLAYTSKAKPRSKRQ
jgi:hypothetical protein